MAARARQGSENKTGDDITRDEMLRYYRQHQAEFTKPARASWEELMVSFAKYPKAGGGLRRHLPAGQ